MTMVAAQAASESHGNMSRVIIRLAFSTVPMNADIIAKSVASEEIKPELLGRHRGSKGPLPEPSGDTVAA